MCRKCYTITSALKSKNVVNHVPFIKNINLSGCRTDSIYLTANNREDNIKYAPFFIHSFNFKLCKIEKDLPDNNLSIPDKLKWFRNEKGLTQKEVSKIIGIDRTNYIDFENIEKEVYPLNTFTKIADLYKIDIEEILDKYNLFIHFGQAEKLKTLRKENNLKQKDLASILNVNRRIVSRWENEKAKISKPIWLKLMNALKNDC